MNYSKTFIIKLANFNIQTLMDRYGPENL